MSTKQNAAAALPRTQAEWRKALEELPSTPEKIPAFFFSHGSPMLAFSPGDMSGGMASLMRSQGPGGSLASFLKDFGSALLAKYRPKGIVVFSAHWDTSGEYLITDYGEENPLLMDYYGFQPALYQLKFKSRGDSSLSRRVLDLFKKAGYLARLTPKTEPRGMDGRGFSGPGLDHGVFVPFRLMFGEEFTDIPIVQVSMDGSLDPRKEWAIGEVVQSLRREGILVLSGGLMVHNLADFSSFSETNANALVKEFDQAVVNAVAQKDPAERKKAMLALVQHRGFRAAHGRHPDHFVPLYIAAGAGGENADVRVLCATYGTPTFAFDP